LNGKAISYRFQSRTHDIKKDAHAPYVANEVISGDQSRRLILQVQLNDTVNDSALQEVLL